MKESPDKRTPAQVADDAAYAEAQRERIAKMPKRNATTDQQPSTEKILNRTTEEDQDAMVRGVDNEDIAARPIDLSFDIDDIKDDTLRQMDDLREKRKERLTEEDSKLMDDIYKRILEKQMLEDE